MKADMQAPVAYTPNAPERHAVDALPGTTLMVFGTNWCGHCQAAQPLIDAFVGRHPDLRVIQIEDGKGRPLGRSYAVKLWPTLIFLRDGQEMERLMRPQDIDSMEHALRRSAPEKIAPEKIAPEPLHLRERILATSRMLLDRDGVAGLSMREVARQAGVTHQAPYHHFQDRESILAELVTRGFNDLRDRLALAHDMVALQGKRAALLASGQAYIGFALEQPGVFRIMFRPDVCNVDRFPQAAEAGERAHAELVRLVRLMHNGDYSDSLASVYWANVHGMACLMLDGPLGKHLPDMPSRMVHVRQQCERFADMMLGAGS